MEKCFTKDFYFDGIHFNLPDDTNLKEYLF